MGKEVNKLTSRQDVLNVWVSKWATFQWLKILNIEKNWPSTKIVTFENDIDLIGNVYEILYSPESNFFEVMFGEVRDGYHKKNCVDSLDPLQYLIYNLNETIII